MWAVIALAALAVPRVILHDLGSGVEAPLQAVLTLGPPLVWVLVSVRARVPSPVLTLVVVGTLYGCALAVTHNLMWDTAFADNDPALGGALAGELDEDAEEALLRAAAAVSSLFTGMVRGETTALNGLQQTERLEYEAYEAMALVKMRQVIAEIRERWPLVQGIAVIQRVGKLEVRQNTILIACASGHRDQGCFEAARYGIDRLKEIVPVWKKEIRADGSAWVEGHYMPQPGDRSTD